MDKWFYLRMTTCSFWVSRTTSMDGQQPQPIQHKEFGCFVRKKTGMQTCRNKFSSTRTEPQCADQPDTIPQEMITYHMFFLSINCLFIHEWLHVHWSNHFINEQHMSTLNKCLSTLWTSVKVRLKFKFQKFSLEKISTCLSNEATFFKTLSGADAAQDEYWRRGESIWVPFGVFEGNTQIGARGRGPEWQWLLHNRSRQPQHRTYRLRRA